MDNMGMGGILSWQINIHIITHHHQISNNIKMFSRAFCIIMIMLILTGVSRELDATREGVVTRRPQAAISDQSPVSVTAAMDTDVRE